MADQITVNVRLHGALRDTLPAEARGRTAVALPAGATVDSLLKHLALVDKGAIVVAVNDVYEAAFEHPLDDGDAVAVFNVIGGGASTVRA